MSRIGRLPVAIPAGVEVTVAEGNVVTVKGPKGTLERALPTEMEIKVEDGHVVVSRPNDLKKMKSLHGLTRSLIHNMVVGVSEGYTKELEVNGVGYKAAKQGKKLTLSLGYSHPVEMEDPDGIETKVDGNKIIVSGISTFLLFFISLNTYLDFIIHRIAVLCQKIIKSSKILFVYSLMTTFFRQSGYVAFPAFSP